MTGREEKTSKTSWWVDLGSPRNSKETTMKFQKRPLACSGKSPKRQSQAFGREKNYWGLFLATEKGKTQPSSLGEGKKLKSKGKGGPGENKGRVLVWGKSSGT